MGQAQAWTMDVIITERGRSLAHAISAGMLIRINLFVPPFLWLLVHDIRMGKPIPDKIYNDKLPSKIGLDLPRGPDPRSFHPSYAANAAAGRKMWKLDA